MNFTIRVPKYIPAKNERLYDGSVRKQSLDVFLLFLVKNGDKKADGLRGKILLEYCAPDIPNYIEARIYQKLKYRLSSSELRMKFYLDLLFDFYKPRDRFLSKYSGLKCLLATKVRRFLFVMEIIFCIQFKH